MIKINRNLIRLINLCRLWNFLICFLNVCLDFHFKKKLIIKHLATKNIHSSGHGLICIVLYVLKYSQSIFKVWMSCEQFYPYRRMRRYKPTLKKILCRIFKLVKFSDLSFAITIKFIKGATMIQLDIIVKVESPYNSFVVRIIFSYGWYMVAI